jgi:Zn-finger nucleic acid-binding protein
MNCISCQAEINPKWVHAIENNVCPSCGQVIMEEHLKGLFSTLRKTMEQLNPYQDQLDDWMLSNHNYIKTTSDQLRSYLPHNEQVKHPKEQKINTETQQSVIKVKTDKGEEDVFVEKLVSDDAAQDFYKRATDVRIKPLVPGKPSAYETPDQKSARLKKMVSQIHKGEILMTSDSEDEVGGMVISPDLLDNADPNVIADYQQMMEGTQQLSSSIADSMDDGVPDHILAANRSIAASKGNVSASNAADLLKLRQMQDRLSSSRESFQNGENRGKGGFSRS